ncbi:TIGR02391 family protein [Methanosarcina barkeri]|uniref:Conserved hypothetical protein CHP02391 domain-containing protein n=1 Tax=Methanosarcina barkeri CM1 TaxID=796385 RepID=A0A0G3CF40_METBA|nr:TIGR02391 family protein [Methanosarcina barkeri]AKJ38578.1 hypothetical protein MCM1_1538 [Methanosarcina barkeri CM1]
MVGGTITVELDLDTILHQRIIDKCMSLYQAGQFSCAALESMKQVELALKEISRTREKKTCEKITGKKRTGGNPSGVKLVETLLESKDGIKLTFPLDDESQKHACTLFKGAFQYYRNYAAHDGSNINKVICIRVMVLASEILDLIGASSISFTEIGGVEGLIDHGIFATESQIIALLSFLSSQVCPYECFEGLFEDLYERGYTDHQFQSVFDLGLIEYKHKIINYSLPGEPVDLDTFGWFELTDLGYMVLKNECDSIV